MTPGDKVVLKPNLVKEGHLFAPNEWEQVITHPVIVECALREVLEALQGEGEVVVADAPQADADWTEIMRRTGLDAMASQLGQEYGISVTCIDLREECWIARNGVVVSARKQQEIPLVMFRLTWGRKVNLSTNWSRTTMERTTIPKRRAAITMKRTTSMFSRGAFLRPTCLSISLR